ncbi:MAG: dihydropteroate synthase [Candidatus Zixiibacteriota bacterium]
MLSFAGEAKRASASALRLKGGRELDLSRPIVMGVVNVTPDSFSDGGQRFSTASAVTGARKLEAEGAVIIDIGGESSRPGAAPVTADEELRRIAPVVKRLRAESDIVISVDTTKSEVASAALYAGADMINDISAGLVSPDMIPLVAESGAGYVLMHMQGRPQTMQDDPTYTDVVSEVREFLAGRVRVCLAAGMEPRSIALDPGIGFGKTARHNLELIGHFDRFSDMGYPLMIGTSRKSFVGGFSRISAPPDRRLGGSLASALEAVRRGARIVRAHDVRETVQALAIYGAVECA